MAPQRHGVEEGLGGVLVRAVPGVEDVMWLDDVADLTTPVELMEEDTVSQYWKDGKALYSVTIEDGREGEATDASSACHSRGFGESLPNA